MRRGRAMSQQHGSQGRSPQVVSENPTAQKQTRNTENLWKSGWWWLEHEFLIFPTLIGMMIQSDDFSEGLRPPTRNGISILWRRKIKINKAECHGSSFLAPENATPILGRILAMAIEMGASNSSHWRPFPTVWLVAAAQCFWNYFKHDMGYMEILVQYVSMENLVSSPFLLMLSIPFHPWLKSPHCQGTRFTRVLASQPVGDAQRWVWDARAEKLF